MNDTPHESSKLKSQSRCGDPQTSSLDVVQRWFHTVITHPQGVEAGVASEEAQALIPLKRSELEQVVTRSRNLSS